MVCYLNPPLVITENLWIIEDSAIHIGHKGVQVSLVTKLENK